MNDGFYRAFEDRHRGSRELIKSRLLVYLPFVKPLHSLYKDAKAIDLGCGRGEWLELLGESGIDGHGVDLDDGMLSVCRERGLHVANADAIAALESLADESQLVVSGFHIAEHLPFSALQSLIQEALRVLKPAGLLILETPNPENIAVGTVNFYLDPTHQKPIPPDLLSFLPAHYGFARVKVIRLQEDKALAGHARISLRDVLGGVSPDYAVVAQKPADDALIACSSDAFAQEYGLTLDALAARFDQQALQASECAASAATLARQASGCAASAATLAQQASERAANSESALIAVLNSSSWRLTAPLRSIGRKVKSLFQLSEAVNSKIKEKIRLLLLRATLDISGRHRLKNAALLVLAPFPALKARLKKAALNASFAQGAAPAASKDLANLTPRARQIYADLKVAIARQQKENS